MKIYFVTGNEGKFEEAKKKFEPIDIELIQKDIGYPEVQAGKLQDVASFGINYLKKRLEKPFMLEDAGLFIKNLKGFPGVYSAYVYYTIGLNGILNLMKNKSKQDRKATFMSVVAFYNPMNKEKTFFEGKCRGFISTEKKGKKGFGYDPIFIPTDQEDTFALMETQEKNRYSHRGKALGKLYHFLKK
ncbi:MAG: XTP/dITP diphosphatase [Candidatus Thermoplasmatota archaeon]